MSQPTNNANPFDALVETFRQVARQEIAAALDSQHEKPPKLLFTSSEAAAIIEVPETWLAASGG